MLAVPMARTSYEATSTQNGAQTSSLSLSVSSNGTLASKPICRWTVVLTGAASVAAGAMNIPTATSVNDRASVAARRVTRDRMECPPAIVGSPLADGLGGRQVFAYGGGPTMLGEHATDSGRWRTKVVPRDGILSGRCPAAPMPLFIALRQREHHHVGRLGTPTEVEAPAFPHIRALHAP